MIVQQIDAMQAQLDAIAPPNPTVAKNPLGSFIISYNDATQGYTAKFNINDKQGISTCQLKRNFSLDPGSATILQTWDMQGVSIGQTLSFDDADPLVRQNSNVYYWVDAIPFQDSTSVLTIGPQQFASNSDLSVPDAISDFDMSHEAAVGGAVAVSAAFFQGQTNFGGAKLYVSGYQGIAAQVAIAQNPASPWKFNMLATGETVTFTAKSVSIQGVESATGPTKVLTLSAAATVPAKIIGAFAKSITAGVQISFPGGKESTITTYQIWRAALGAGFGAAANIGSVTPTGSVTYTFLDGAGLASSYEYYVIAVNPTGSSPANNASNIVTLDGVPDGVRVPWNSVAQRTAAVDVSGNIKLKNKLSATGITSNPVNGSTTYFDLIDLSITITVNNAANKVLLIGYVISSNSSQFAFNSFAFFRNGSQISGDFSFQEPDANNMLSTTLVFVDTPPSGSQVYTIGWKVSAGTATAQSTNRNMSAVELG